MKEDRKEPIALPARDDTVRREIIAALEEGAHSARDLSVAAGIPEREVAGHLEHIKKTIAPSGHHLIIMSAECKKCGFVFAKRDKLTRPGKCPICRGESIREPRYSISRVSR